MLFLYPMCSVCSVAESQNSQHQFFQWLLSYHHNLLVFLPNYFLIKVSNCHCLLDFQFHEDGSSLRSSESSLSTALTCSVCSQGCILQLEGILASSTSSCREGISINTSKTHTNWELALQNCVFCV